MKRRAAHAGFVSQILDPQRLRVVSFQPFNDPGYLLALAPCSSNLAQTCSLIPHQQTVDDLPLDKSVRFMLLLT